MDVACEGDAAANAHVAQPSGVCESTRIVSILQTERRISVLYALPGGQHLHVLTSIPVWLQSMGGGNAEVYVEALGGTAFDLPSSYTGASDMRQRVVCTDAAASVERAERANAWLLRNEASGSRTKCEIHKSYNMHTEIFEQIAASVSKLKHIGMALCAGDPMRSFR